MSKFPERFQFTRDMTSSMYNMQKTHYEGEVVWMCTHTKDGFAERHPRSYSRFTEDDIISYLNQGTWKYVGERPDVERALVFPFTVRTAWDNIYSVYKDFEGVIHMQDCEGTSYARSEQEVRNFIKQGLWIVQSVGEQKPVGAPTTDVGTLKLGVDSQDVKEATEAFKELADAIDNANVSLGIMRQVMSEMGGSVASRFTGNAIVEPVQDYSGLSLDDLEDYK